MKHAKYKRYLRLARWNSLDIHRRPWVMITREIPIEEARRMFPTVPDVPDKSWHYLEFIQKMHGQESEKAFRSKYFGGWVTAESQSPETAPSLPAGLPPGPPA